MNKEVQNKSIRKREYHYLSLKCIYSTNNNKRRLKKKSNPELFTAELEIAPTSNLKTLLYPFSLDSVSFKNNRVPLYKQ